MTTNTTPTTTASNKTALHLAAEALRAAEKKTADALRAVDAHVAILRAQSIQARESKSKMYDAFHAMAVQGWIVVDLRRSCESYDREHLRALTERNLCGDLLDRAALNDFGRKSSPEDLEYAAVRFNAAQQVLDAIQKGEPAEKRKRDGRALHEAEAEQRRLKAAYEAGKSAYEGENEKVGELDQRYNELHAAMAECGRAEDECRKALRLAARAYGKEVTA